MGEARLTMQEAAKALGVSETAIRRRVKRGTLKHEREDTGRIYVYLTGGVDRGQTRYQTGEPDALISEMRERLAFLERELEVRTEEIRRRDTIIMNMTEAMKALNPPSHSEATKAPESSVSPGPTSHPTEAPEGPQTDAQRPWWRKVFGR